jgi:hypothetical protein
MSKERIMLRVTKGALEPADNYSRERLRERGYRVGDVLASDLRKPRNPAFFRLAHAFGKLVADNIEEFSGMDAHSVLKRLQIEANVGCDEMLLNLPGVGKVVYRMPQSLAFDSMDDGQFREVYMGMCRHVAERYWSGLSAEQIAAMAETMPEAA